VRGRPCVATEVSAERDAMAERSAPRLQHGSQPARCRISPRRDEIRTNPRPDAVRGGMQTDVDEPVSTESSPLTLQFGDQIRGRLTTMAHDRGTGRACGFVSQPI
jgi:hypothetical protein